MLKITILGIALAAIALAGTMSVADYKTIPLSLTQERDGVQTHDILCSDVHVPMKSPSGLPVCVFEESVLKLEKRGFEFTGEPFDMFPIKSTDMPGAHGVPELTAGPVISMSTLPAIGETAIVEITYTNLFDNFTAGEIASGHDHFKIGWTVGTGFEIVDNGGNTPVKRVWNKNTPLVSSYWEFLPLNLNESKTYRIEVRAVDAGLAFVAGSGYLGSGTALYLYLDQDETLPLQEHRTRYPEMHQRSTVQSTPQPPLPREEVEYVPPSRELLADFFVAYFAGSDPEEIGAAMDFVQMTGWHLNYTLPDLKQILGDAGYTDKEIEAEWSSRASTQSSTRDHLSSFFVNGWLQNDQITLGVGKTNLVNSAEVCVVVTNQVTEMSVAMGCADTSQYGVFSLESSRVDIIRNDTVDIETIIKSKGEHALVRNTDMHITGKVINTSSSVHGLGYFVNAPIDEDDGDLRNAFWIVDSISDVHDYFTAHGIDVPQVIVNWESGASPGDFTTTPKGDGSHYDPNNMQIYLDGIDEINNPTLIEDDDDSYNRFIIIHEFAHYLMDAAYSPTNPFTAKCPMHFFDEPSNVGCGWTEGWAGFVPFMVDFEPLVDDPMFNSSSVVYPRSSIAGYDLEQVKVVIGSRARDIPTEDAAGNPIGQEIEARVAGALWDIYDDHSGLHDRIGRTSHDNMAEGDDEIVAIFLQKPRNFNDFDNMWNTNYGSKPTLSIMKLHGMDFAFETPTAVSQDGIRVVSGTTTSIALRGEDPTIPNTNLSFILDSSPDRGNLFKDTNEITNGDTIPTSTPTAAVLDYAANYGTSGPDSFTFYVTDRRGASSTPATVSITITPVPGITFESYLESRTNIRLHFSMPISNLQAGDFTSSHGTIDGISPIRSSTDYSLRMSGVPAGAQVTITYVGESFNIPNNAGQLVSGTSSTSSKPTDTTPPTITAPSDRTFEATGALTPLTAAQIGTATAIDNEDPNPTVTSGAPASFPLGTTAITWTATDSSDNSATATQTITVRDTTPPTITAPADASFTTPNTSVTLTVSDYGTATAIDLVDSLPAITSDAPSSFPVGTTTITWTATDDHSNSAQATQRITVVYSSLRITAPADILVEATGTLTPVDIGTATATHDTDTNIAIRNDAPASFPLGVTTVTWTATDSSGITTTAIQTVTVRDTTDPVFGAATDLDFVFEPDVPLIIRYDSPTATDVADPSVDVACTPASGSTFSEGSTTVSCTATDDSGNSATVVFDIDVLVYDSTIFRDGFDGSIDDSWTNNNQDSFWSTNYNVPVTVPGHDSANKIAQASLCNFPGGCVMELTDGLDLSNHTDPEFLEFYRYVDDELDDTEYLKLEAYDGTVWTELDRWSPENSDNDGAWHLEEYALSDYTGSTDFKVRFTAVSSASLDEFGIDDVRVFKDPYRTQPAVTAPADIVAEATGQYTILDIGSATATDDTDSSPTITNDAPASFPLGTTTVTWTATDSDGNSSTDTQTVTVRDTTPPAITPPPNAPFGTSGTSLSLTESDYGTATATDLVDQTPAITNNAPASFPIGATVITWTATDDSLNSAAANQTVVVAGSVPVIAAPADLTVEATGSLTVADIGNATAADGTDPDPAIANDAPASFPLGRTVVTWTVTDSEGNFSTDIQTVTVQDTTAPVMGPVQNQAFSFAPGETLAVNYAVPTATDMVDASVEINCNPASGSVFAQGVTLVTCLATDDHDNFVTATFNVNVAVSAPVVGSTLFLDDFEDGDLIGWDVPGFFLTWRADAFDDSAVPPGHNSTNKVAEADWCDAECTMTMVAGIDLTGQANATLQFYRYVDVGLDSNEYLKVEAYNGTAWAQLDIWTPENGDDDDAWHLEEYSLSGYSGVADFKVRFAAFMSSHIEDVAIDDVKVFVRP